MTPSLLWLDLEMTGLDPAADRVLEAAAIITDWDFNELATYRAIVAVDPDFAAARMTGKFWDEHPESRAALLAQNSSPDAKPSDQVEAELLAFLAEHFAPDAPVYLAGNSIHQDRRFIAAEWPALDARLHYRMLDVTSWKLIMENRYKLPFIKPEEHRADADIRGSIAELKFYLTRVSRQSQIK
jgi:oligoribonuclease